MKDSTVSLAAGAFLALAGSAAPADVTLPKGTSIEVRVVTPFDSDTVVKGGTFQADERKKILEQEAKLTTGRKLDVVLIGSGTEPNRKASMLVGTSGENREDLADEWAASGLGPASVAVSRGTVLAMRLDKTLTITVGAGVPAAGDRNILVSADDVRRAQQALKARGAYAGEASGVLDEPTRRAIASFQIDHGQPATGDLDDVTARELAAAKP